MFSLDARKPLNTRGSDRRRRGQWSVRGAHELRPALSGEARRRFVSTDLFGGTWVSGINSQYSLDDLRLTTTTIKAVLPSASGIKNNHFDRKETSPFVQPTSGKNPKGVQVVNPMVLTIRAIMASRTGHRNCRGRAKQARTTDAADVVKVRSKLSTTSIVLIVIGVYCRLTPVHPRLTSLAVWRRRVRGRAPT